MSDSSLSKRPNVSELGHHPGYGSPSLRQMHDDESDENEADVGMNRVPDVQDGQCGKRATQPSVEVPDVRARAQRHVAWRDHFQGVRLQRTSSG